MIKQIKIKVYPNSKTNEFIEEKDMFENITYKIKTTQAPEDGKANKAVIEIIAKHFKVAKSKVKIISGLTFKEKWVEVEF